MAIEFIKAKVISRSTGGNAIQCAAYRSCSKLYDSSIGKTFNYSNKRGLAYSNILIPETNEKYKNRELLWNKIEEIENSHKRKNSAQLSFELTMALPKELSLEHQITLSESFIKDNYVDKFKVIADINIHHDNLDNPHAHVMLTFRSFKAGEFEKAKIRNMTTQVFSGNGKKYATHDGLNSKWRDYQNFYFKRCGIDLEVDSNFIIPTKHEGRISEQNHEIKLANYQKKLLSAQLAISEPELIIEILEHKYTVFGEQEISSIIKKNTDILNDNEVYKKAVNAILTHKNIIELGYGENGRLRYTTKNTYKKEEQLIITASNLDGRINKEVNAKLLGDIIQGNGHAGEYIEQAEALKHIANSGDIVCVVGRAGAGKTHTMASVKQMYESLGYSILGTSLSEKATRGLEESSGIKSENIRKLLTKIANPRMAKYLPKQGSVIVVDEAGMVGLGDMLSLMKYSKDNNIKLILIGDPDQLQPIQSGAPFRAIAENIGFAELNNIVRQKNELDRIASLNLAKGNVGLAVEHYKDNISIDNPEVLKHQIVAKWNEYNSAKQQVLMMAYTNDDVSILNQLARGYLKEQEIIVKEDILINTSKGKMFLSRGDKILFTAKDKDLGVYNGLETTITHIDNNKISCLVEGKEITFDVNRFNQFNLAYATTIHKAQGVTVDNALLYANSYGFDRHLAYVGMTRHKHNLNIYANNEVFGDLEELKRRFSSTPMRDSSFDYPYQLGVRHGVGVEESAFKAVTYIKQVYYKVRNAINYLRTFNEHKTADSNRHNDAILVADFADLNTALNQDYMSFKNKYSDKWYESDEAVKKYAELGFQERFFKRNELASAISKEINKYQRALELNHITPTKLKLFSEAYNREILVIKFAKLNSQHLCEKLSQTLKDNEYTKYVIQHGVWNKLQVHDQSYALRKENLLTNHQEVAKYLQLSKEANKYYRKAKLTDKVKQSPKHRLYEQIASQYYKRAGALAYKLLQDAKLNDVLVTAYSTDYSATILRSISRDANSESVTKIRTDNQLAGDLQKLNSNKEISLNDLIDIKNRLDTSSISKSIEPLLTSKLTQKLESRPFVLKEIDSGKVFAIGHNPVHVISAIKVVNPELGNYMTSRAFIASLPRPFEFYTTNEFLPLLAKFPNAPKFELYDSIKWANRNNVKLSAKIVQKQVKKFTFK